MNLTLSVKLITFLLFLSNHFLNSISAPNGEYDACSPRIKCGQLSDISYPFYDEDTRPEYCGYPGFKLDCKHDGPQISISSLYYYLLSISETTATVARTDISSTNCLLNPTNTTVDHSPYQFTSSDRNITLFYDCIHSISGIPVNCQTDEGSFTTGYYMTRRMQSDSNLNLSKVCSGSMPFPILKSSEDAIDISISEHRFADMNIVFHQGFELEMNAEFELCNECVVSGGQCGYNSSSNKFVCYCLDDNYDTKCAVNSYKGHHNGLMVQITASVAGVIGIVMVFLIIFSKYILQKCKPITTNRKVEDCLKNYASLVPKRYTYTNIKKITKSFREKIGEGGYGTVFKGSFQDGHVVAVKVLKPSKGDDQEFLNEVMSISRTSHINIVPLLGFCFEGQKRALIYEFMPNGSLEKFIHGKDSHERNQSLTTQKLLEIVVGIARGLEYLHRGCNIRIVHFDIKPHNILLDAEFTPKISDFGLAKSIKDKESIISMSGARGTTGYIAPEVILRSIGGVSHKSDVYSFGMMTLEIVGCKKRRNQNVVNSSEMYFPQWIYKQLEQEAILDYERILNDNEKEMERKMILVGLWCIQTDPRSRPSMSRVVEMLQGKVELLEVPPMPSLASPPRQLLIDEDSETLNLSSLTHSIVRHSHSPRNC